MIDLGKFPPGHYVCPSCNGWVDAYVELNAAPTHRCGVGRKVKIMEYRGEPNASSRNSVRGLDKPEQS